MALVVACAFAAVMVGILAVTRLFSTRVAAGLTVLSLVHVALRVRRQRRYAATVRRPHEGGG
ncbi:hypothetical protein M3148_15155 [Georgenia satyanarayanai]|uniref:hypothetical protein n=1 Tax=Georgenia satyanarayanai TaxID=860221 RepID=UPI00203BDCF4|nr:hypothetical protein [Georgenia satyanarayanai]MCM3662318.1 hypothetical protein [Georgenia satyanarayanai]